MVFARSGGFCAVSGTGEASCLGDQTSETLCTGPRRYKL